MVNYRDGILEGWYTSGDGKDRILLGTEHNDVFQVFILSEN